MSEPKVGKTQLRHPLRGCTFHHVVCPSFPSALLKLPKKKQ